MDEPDPFAAPLVGIASRGGSRGSCGGWKRLRRSCILASLLILAALQVVGAFRLRGNAGLELLLAALAPGAAVFWLLHWAAGKKRLSTLASLEFVALGAVFSVLVAVGLELVSLLIFRNELRLCMPIQSQSVRAAVLQKESFQSIGNSGQTGLQTTLAVPENVSSVKNIGNVSLIDYLPLPVEWLELSPLTQFLRHITDSGMAGKVSVSYQNENVGGVQTFVGPECGVGARGIISNLAPFLLPQPFNLLYRQPQRLFDTPFLHHAAETHAVDDDFHTETFVCTAFVFFYMVVCIGFAEEVAKALAMFAVRPALVPPLSILEQNAAVAAEVGAVNGLLDRQISHEKNACGVYVKHPLAMVMAGCCAALGFATMENVSYVFSPRSAIDTALATAWVRAFTAIPSHTANTGIAACFIASVAARAVAAKAPTLAASAGATLADAQSVAVAEAAGRGEDAENLQSVGDAREVDATPGSQAAFVPWTDTAPSSVASAAAEVAFFFSSLLPSAVLPALLHGTYDAALTLTTLSQGKSGGGSYTGLSWLLLALLAWMMSLAIFIKRWCAVKGLEDFWVYFYARDGAWHRPSQVVPFAGHSVQLLHASTQQPPLEQQQQLLHQQRMLQRQIQQQQLLQEQQQQLLHQQMLQYHLQQQLIQQGFVGAQLAPSSLEATEIQNTNSAVEAQRALMQLTCVAGVSPTAAGYGRQMRQYAPVTGPVTVAEQSTHRDSKEEERYSSQ